MESLGLTESDKRKNQVQLELREQYPGKWVAWNEGQTAIVASGDSLTELQRSVQDSGEVNTITEKISANTRSSIGGVAVCS